MAAKGNKIILWGSLIAVTAIGATIIVSVQRKKKIVKQIEDKINGNSLSGTFSDLSSSNAFNDTYWKNVSGNLLTVTEAQGYAASIASILTGTDTNTSLISVFKNLKNQAQVSQVTFYYNQSGGNLYTDLNKINTIGSTVVSIGNIFGLSYFFPNIEKESMTSQILNYINALPAK